MKKKKKKKRNVQERIKGERSFAEKKKRKRIKAQDRKGCEDECHVCVLMCLLLNERIPQKKKNELLFFSTNVSPSPSSLILFTSFLLLPCIISTLTRTCI